MKAQKKLNIVMTILIILLISIISFVGIFYQNENQMKDIVPSYKLGTNLKGYRKIILELKDSSSDSNTTNETTENSTEANTSENVNNVTNETNTVESNENTSDNYKKCASIIEKRLSYLKVEDFTVVCDSNTGIINILLPENDQTDTIISDITQKGNFVIEDSNTNEVLMDNSDIRNVEVTATKSSTSSSTTNIYMNMNFNLKGTNKFKNITKNYQNLVNESSTDNSTNTAENNTESTNNSTNEAESTSNTNRQVILKIDDTTMMTTNFSEVIDNGTLSLTIGSSSSSSTSTSTYKDKLYGAYNLGAIISNEAMPLQYQVYSNEYVSSQIDENGTKIMVYIEIGIALIIALIMIIKYRLNGVMSVISSIGFMAIVLLAIRYTNVELSIEGIFAIEIAYVMNTVCNIILCEKIKAEELTDKEKKKAFKEVTKQSLLTEIPILILSIVFCLNNWSTLFSFGMVIFWGILINTVYNLIMDYLIIDLKK